MFSNTTQFFEKDENKKFVIMGKFAFGSCKSKLRICLVTC